MTSKYAVVQFYPDPASDERLDIGVVAWDEEGAHVVFIESWERAPTISVDEVYLLQDYAQLLQQRLTDRTVPHLDENTGELAEHLINIPMPGIRLTPTQSAPGDAPTLAADLAAQLHSASGARSERVRDRRIAASHAYRSITGALRKRAPRDAKALIHARRMLEGKFGRHQFDVVLAADEPFAAVSALSFEVTSQRNLQREADATAWALDDVHKLRPDLPLAVFVLPPTNAQAEVVHRGAAKTFKGLGVRMIAGEPAIARWALQQVKESRGDQRRTPGPG